MTTIFQQGRKPSKTRYPVYPAFRSTPPNRTRLKLWLDFGGLTVYKSSASSTAPVPSNIFVPASLTRRYLDPCYCITLGQVTTETNRTTGPTLWLDWQMVRWFHRRIMRRSINSSLRIFLSLEVQPSTLPPTTLTEAVRVCVREQPRGSLLLE
jgi:hypothetical protein